MRPGGLEATLNGWHVASVITEICERAGIPAEAINVDGLEGGIDGLLVSADQDAYSTIEALGAVFLFDVSNYDGQLHAVPRGGPVVANIVWDDLVDGEDFADKSERLDSLDVPRMLNLEYMDYDGGLTPDKQVSDRSLDARSRGEARSQTPVILRTADAARSVLIQHKVSIEDQRGGYEFSLPDSWIWLTNGDVITYETERLRIVSIEIDDGFQTYSTVHDRITAYESSVAGVPIDQPSTPPTLAIGDTVAHFIDCHILEDADDTLGYYVAANSAGEWQGAIAELSLDGGMTYIDEDSTRAPSVMGVLETALGAGPVAYPDEVNTCRVRLLRDDDELIDATLAEMMNRRNLAMIGNELVNFGGADEVSPGLWDLSVFLRGRKGSASVSHPIGARFVMLNLSALSFIAADLFLYQRDLTFRITSLGAESASAAVAATFNGVSQKERQSAYLTAKRVGGNLVISWQGVGRIGGGGRVAMGAFFTGYRVTVDGVIQPDTTARTITVTYPGSGKTVTVQQVNQLTGVGPALTVVT